MQSVIVEIRAAEGGDDAKLLVEDQLRIYNKFCSLNGYWLKILSIRQGYVSTKITGENIVEVFKNEAGGHRWQRIPPNEKRGRIQTSTITVAVLEEISNVKTTIPENDIIITISRGSGNGGQHRNVTDSAVQIKHLPTGIIVRIESERSQYQNKQLALEILQQKINHLYNSNINNELNNKRKNQLGSGMRGDKIRTIRVKDDVVINHINGKRISFKKYSQGLINLF